MSVTVHYVGPGIVPTPKQQQANAAFAAFLGAAAEIAAEIGEDAVLGGLLSAYVHYIDRCGRHADAISGLKLAIAMMEKPEMIRLDVQGRA